MHRDIKPENILLAGDQAIVADFGIARAVAVAGGERLTGTGLAVGTPAYMSPEQAVGDKNIDARSDVYALGCVVYEMVSGQAPFEGATPQEMLAKHAVDTAPSLRTTDPSIPLFLERAVERALAKSPADRFQTANAFAGALTSELVVARVGRARWPRRVAAAAAVVVVLVAAWGLFALGGGSAYERLAVLPPVNLMNDSEQEHIIQGMYHGLISELGQAGITIVGSIQSMMRYQDTEMTVREIAAELRVDAVIESSFLWVGDTVAIDARLTDGRTEESLWSQSYDEDARNVLALYRQVTGAVADEIHAVLTPQAEAVLASARPVDPEAWEAYLKGKFFLNQRTPEGYERGLALLQEAIDKDSTNPFPHAALAVAYAEMGHGGGFPDAFARARAAAAKAEELGGEGLGEMYVALGTIRLYADWDLSGAGQDLQRAIELNPSIAQAHRHYSWYLFAVGQREDALASMRRAQEVDPVDPFLYPDRGWQYWAMGQYDNAIEEARKSLDLVPDYGFGLAILGMAYAGKEMYTEAIAAHERMAAINPDWRWGLATTYAQAGREDDARRVLTEFLDQEPPPTGYSAGWDLAAAYAALGDTDEALRWLEAAYQERSSFMPWIEDDPSFAPLRSDPRFQDLVQRIGLPER